MESDNSLIDSNNQLSSDNRCYRSVGPILTRYEYIFQIDYNNQLMHVSIHDMIKEYKKNKSIVLEELITNYNNKYEPMKFLSINDIMKECKKNKAFVLEELVIDCTTICNRIACSLLYGSQMQYKKDSYKKSDDICYDWSGSLSDIMGDMLNKTENDSATFFNEELTNKDITVSSNLLKQLDEAIKDANFEVFDNPNYLNKNVNFVQLFKCLGNKILELSRNAFTNMYYKMQSPECSNSEDKKEYLDRSIFGDIILPFYYNLNKIKDSLYELENHITCKDYDKMLLNKQLKSTADYINNVLNNSKINEYSEHWMQLKQLPIKNTLNYAHMYRGEYE